MRKGKMKGTLVIVLVIVMIFTIVACSGNQDAGNSSNKDADNSSNKPNETKEVEPVAPVDIRFFRVAVTQDPTKDRVLLELQKRTNTKLEFVTAPWDQYVTKTNTILASNEKMDIIALEDRNVNYPELARGGKLQQLDDLLNSGKYPNMKALAYDPLFKTYLIDGKVYGIPQPVQPGGGWIAGIRKDWLDNVGLPVPQTPEDLYNVFKSFKEQDPDGNGKDDTLAMLVTPFNPWNFLLLGFMKPVEFEEKDGTIEYTYTGEGYKNAIKFIKRLYDDDLINKDFLTIKDRDISINQFMAGKTGIAYSPMWAKTLEATKENDPKTNVELLFPVPHDPATTNGATSSDAQWHWLINVIPANSKNAEKSLEFLEYLSTDEGRKLMSAGIEGIHYDSYQDGVFTGLKTEEQNKDWDPANGEGPTGYPLWWGMVSTINGTIDHANNQGNLLKSFQEATTFVTAEDKQNNPFYEQRKLITTIMAHEAVPALLNSKSKYSGKLKSIQDEFAAKMILGKSSDFDKHWTEYVDKMNKSGLDEIMVEATEWYNQNK